MDFQRVLKEFPGTNRSLMELKGVFQEVSGPLQGDHVVLGGSRGLQEDSRSVEGSSGL